MQDSHTSRPPAECFGTMKVANIYGFPGQRSLQHVFDPAGSQSWKDLHRYTSQDFVRTLSGQPLHERVEELIAQFVVIKDDSLGRTHDDRLADFGSGLGGSLSVFSADAGHDLADDRLDGIVGKGERIAFSNKRMVLRVLSRMTWQVLHSCRCASRRARN